MTWIGVLTSRSNDCRDSDWRPVTVSHRRGWTHWRLAARKPPRALATGATNIVQLGKQAKQGGYGRGPADPGGVTAPGIMIVTSRLDGGPTGRRREDDSEAASDAEREAITNLNWCAQDARTTGLGTRVLVRLGWVGKGGRGGGCGESNHLPSQKVSGQQAHQLHPPPARPPRLYQGRVQVCARPRQRDAQICNKGVVLSRPTAMGRKISIYCKILQFTTI